MGILLCLVFSAAVCAETGQFSGYARIDTNQSVVLFHDIDSTKLTRLQLRGVVAFAGGGT